MDSVFQALEQLREIMAFENNGTTSRLVDFFRFCTRETTSTTPPVTLLVNSSEPTEVTSISSTIVMAPDSTIETSFFTKLQLDHSPTAIISSPTESYISEKASSSIEVDSTTPNVGDVVVTSSVDSSQEENRFPWLNIRNLDECDAAKLQFKNYIDDVILAPYGHIKRYQEFLQLADDYSRSHYVPHWHRPCFTLTEEGMNSLNYFWTVVDLIDNFLNMKDLASFREILQFPKLVGKFNDKLRQFCGWMAGKFQIDSQKKLQKFKTNIGTVQIKILQAKKEIFDWKVILEKWQSFPIENIEQYLDKDITKQELPKQFLSQQNVAKRENFFQDIKKMEDHMQVYQNHIEQVRNYLSKGYHSLRTPTPVTIIDDNSVQRLDLVQKAMTVVSMRNWTRKVDLQGIIGLIPSVIQENINELNRNTTESMIDIRSKIKMLETNLREYEDSINMKSQFYL